MSMMHSILQSKKECYFCKTTHNLDRHHIMNGAFKKKSEKFGGMVYLCRKHHTTGGKECVHENADMRIQLKRDFQRKFLEIYDMDMWMRLFKTNYLEEEND